jgi:iduronate 2-sulfatase
MDTHLGRILDELDALGLADSTAIVFTSDHGYHLGDHTFWQKANLHEQVTRVPLIIAAPGIKPERSRSIVQLVDVFPTLCELTGAPIPASVQGRSLVPVLHDATAKVHEAALSYDGQQHALRSDRWAFMRYTDETEELYEMDADPGQLTNLAKNPEHEATLASFRQQLQVLLKSSGEPKRKKKAKK